MGNWGSERRGSQPRVTQYTAGQDSSVLPTLLSKETEQEGRKAGRQSAGGRAGSWCSSRRGLEREGELLVVAQLWDTARGGHPCPHIDQRSSRFLSVAQETLTVTEARGPAVSSSGLSHHHPGSLQSPAPPPIPVVAGPAPSQGWECSRPTSTASLLPLLPSPHPHPTRLPTLPTTEP